jgi:hypothetical protein
MVDEKGLAGPVDTNESTSSSPDSCEWTEKSRICVMRVDTILQKKNEKRIASNLSDGEDDADPCTVC